VKIRVLLAKPGLDGHDRGVKLVARALCAASMEVIYTGLRQTPEMIAQAALGEGVHVVGLSILSGAHMTLFPKIIEQLRQEGMQDVAIVAGGTIPPKDVPLLLEMGVSAVFGPGSRLQEIVQAVREAAHPAISGSQTGVTPLGSKESRYGRAWCLPGRSPDDPGGGKAREG
jgi:methylmalonyl-CoA mutase C-terminal domain/subunit